MNNIEIGPAIKHSYEFLTGVFSDTSKLLTIVEERMKKNKFHSLWGSASVWNRSAAYYGYYGWLPHYMSRVYVDTLSSENKPSLEKKLCVFVNIYFVPRELEQPVILFGVVKFRLEDIWTTWNNIMLNNEEPEFIDSDRIEEWKEIEVESEASIDKIFYQIRRLTEIKNQPATQAICDEAIKKFREVENV